MLHGVGRHATAAASSTGSKLAGAVLESVYLYTLRGRIQRADRFEKKRGGRTRGRTVFKKRGGGGPEGGDGEGALTETPLIIILVQCGSGQPPSGSV